jgi:hypothetical protein
MERTPNDHRQEIGVRKSLKEYALGVLSKLNVVTSQETTVKSMAYGVVKQNENDITLATR